MHIEIDEYVCIYIYTSFQHVSYHMTVKILQRKTIGLQSVRCTLNRSSGHHRRGDLVKHIEGLLDVRT